MQKYFGRFVQILRNSKPSILAKVQGMSDDVLSREDVESLLQSNKVEGSQQTAAATEPRARIFAYDFKRPERIGKDQMRAMQSLHETLARSFGAALSAMLRTMIEVRLISVDQLTYSEFIYSLEVPTCYNLLKPMPLEGNWILDFSQSLLYPMIDRMLGGTVKPEGSIKRPLSEIELRLAGRITNTFLRELEHTWRNVVELNIEVERVESNPQLVQIVPPNEVVIMISFELTMGGVRGMTNLCIPFNTLERVGTKLTNNSWVGYTSAKSDRTSQDQLAKRLEESVVGLKVILARSTISTGDLFDLQPGDIISTDHDVKSMLDVEIADVVKFKASPGSLKGRKAIKIESVIHGKDSAVRSELESKSDAAVV
jgi:flagellar motor switch protein FliM